MPSETAAPVADRGIDPNQSFASVFVTPPDGPMLHVRSYGPRFAAALPVVCLPGLARTAADFHPWQRRWRPTLPRRDMCWRSIIAATVNPNTIAIQATTRLLWRSPTSWPS